MFLFKNIKNEFIVFGEIFDDKKREEGAIDIIEKNMMSNHQQYLNTTTFDIELSDLYYKNIDKIDLTNHFQYNSQPIVLINTNIFSCELEKIGSESVCLSLSDCDNKDNCGAKLEAIPNLIIIGKEPIYSLVTTSHLSGNYSKQVKLQPGEYEIFPTDNDVISSNYCKKIELDGLGFEEFTTGTNIPKNDKSILCINIGDSCYGTIKIGETKICDINKVVINK